MNHKKQPCDCELPGDFCSGVPGVLARMEAGRLHPDAVVERCDQCCRFPSDAATRNRLVELELADQSEDLSSFTVHCLAVVRVKFPGVLASSAKEAAQRTMDRFDWDAHTRQAEFADELTGAVVDVDGDDDHRQTIEFDHELQEVSR